VTGPAAAMEQDLSLVEGRLAEMQEGGIVLALPGTDYRLHLRVEGSIGTAPGEKIRGRVIAQARRIDVIKSGGRYIEPVDGRPRRVQGRVIAVDESRDALLVRAAAPIRAHTNDLQTAADFSVDQMVSFDVEPGARFEPAQ